MNYTLTQAIDRTRDLSGAIKAADELERLTADTLGAKEHEVTLARQAHDKAVANQDALRAEREALAEHTASLVRKIGEPLDLPPSNAVVPTVSEKETVAPVGCIHPAERREGEPGDRYCGDCLASETMIAFEKVPFNSIFTEDADNLAQRLMDRSEERMNGAFEAAS